MGRCKWAATRMMQMGVEGRGVGWWGIEKKQRREGWREAVA
jgi:hypothetical protein